ISGTDYTCALSDQNERYAYSWRPLFISMTSKSDWATKLAYPLGAYPNTMLERFEDPPELPTSDSARLNAFGKDLAHKKRSNFSEPGQPSERTLATHTPGHTQFLLSHRVEVDIDSNAKVPETCCGEIRPRENEQVACVKRAGYRTVIAPMSAQATT